MAVVESAPKSSTTRLTEEPPAPQKLQPRKRDSSLFGPLDDSGMIMADVIATHASDGRLVDVKTKLLLQVVEDILERASPTRAAHVTQAHMEAVEYMTEEGIHGVVADTIRKIGSEIQFHCSGTGRRDLHPLALDLLTTLSMYSWDTKAVIVMAAFGINYGDFWLTSQICTTNSLAKSLSVLKQVPEVLSHVNKMLKPRLDALSNLIRGMLDLTKSLTEFYDLPVGYLSGFPAMSMASNLVPTAVYWIIRSVLVCTSQFNSILSVGHHQDMGSWDVSTLAYKLGDIHAHLKDQLTRCHKEIEERKLNEVYQTLVRLFDTTQVDNLRVLRVLIHSIDDHQPLLDGFTKTRVGVEVLGKKTVVLLISDLDITAEELTVLENVYGELSQQTKSEKAYEMVWLPVVQNSSGWMPAKQQETFKRLQSAMPWYSLHHPSLLHPAVIQYMKEVWQYEKKPLLVVLDPLGRVVCTNAIHMMWIWGNAAFPFTRKREEDLWNQERWSMVFVVNGIDETMLSWIREGKPICLYGGEDINWIRKFTSTMRSVTDELKISIEMMYVGKSNPKERVRSNINAISSEKLSYYLPELTFIWFFWVRLESMWYSKTQQGRTIADDNIMREVMSLLTFDGSNQGWAILGHGNGEMTKASGNRMLEALESFPTWKENAVRDGFIPALARVLASYHSKEHCASLVLPRALGKDVHEHITCAECNRPMEKYVLYRCCDE
ncbi:PREDICTED: protein SIEVE ELEMENT OCCLUSION B-like [Nelumbo nucifera]|uniref:Protein SIEVE ELEMENT OCCLUSION B-like n=2 Tax=Nelumbo nucifera TaxID=4432 RepID=A0A822YGZ8_NELNU|nr:PREDICTED: protein SIEVE ELEMENT OCCLUSION B-like [Nelumbo nucifera]DAD30741.1 TPA_asm: hypothetical protein HUJ06_009592 [Nelumbo nucifera]